MLGGMRGAISVALVASLPPSSFKSILQTLTFGVVLLSLVIQYIALSKYVKNVFHYDDATIDSQKRLKIISGYNSQQ